MGRMGRSLQNVKQVIRGLCLGQWALYYISTRSTYLFAQRQFKGAKLHSVELILLRQEHEMTRRPYFHRRAVLTPCRRITD